MVLQPAPSQNTNGCTMIGKCAYSAQSSIGETPKFVLAFVVANNRGTSLFNIAYKAISFKLWVRLKIPTETKFSLETRYIPNSRDR